MVRHAPVLLAALAAAASAVAQTPNADWRTVTTTHFRVHYTAPAEAWALRAASRMESVRARVVAEVGYEPPQVTDVLVTDPVAQILAKIGRDAGIPEPDGGVVASDVVRLGLYMLIEHRKELTAEIRQDETWKTLRERGLV